MIERIDSSHSVWLFDTERMRFRRLPRGADPAAPPLESDWEPYFALDLADDGSFTVALNEERTRLLRSWRDDATPAPAEGVATGELRLEAAEE